MLIQAPPQDVTSRLAVAIRRTVIEMSSSPNGVHIGGSMSIADLLSVSTADRVRTLEIIAKLVREGIAE